MAVLIGIVGESGTGKSRSALNLDNKSTYIINVQGKSLPWRGSASNYNAELKNIANIDAWNKVQDTIVGVANNRPEIKTIFVDDSGFIMATEFFKRASESGFAKFSEIGQHMFNIIDSSKKLRDDLKIIFTFHPEVDTDLLGQSSKKIKTIGECLPIQNCLNCGDILKLVILTQSSNVFEGQNNYLGIVKITRLDNPQPSVPQGWRFRD